MSSHMVLLLLTALFAMPLMIPAQTATPAPSQGKVARTGFDLHYRVYGKGNPVVLLSGGPGMDCDYMEPVAVELGKTHRAILVELRGTGRSLPPEVSEKTINEAEYVADIEALRADLGLNKWTLLGHSAGAMVAMAYGGAHPDRVNALVLANSGPLRSSSARATGDNIAMRLSAEEKRAAYAAFDRNDVGTGMKLSLPGQFFDREKAAAMAARFRPESYHPEVGRLINLDHMKPSTDYSPALARLGRPVLVIAGRQDPLDPAVQYEIHLAAKRSKLVLLPKCGHFSWIEQPEEFYREIREFLARAQTR